LKGEKGTAQEIVEKFLGDKSVEELVEEIKERRKHKS